MREIFDESSTLCVMIGCDGHGGFNKGPARKSNGGSSPLASTPFSLVIFHIPYYTYTKFHGFRLRRTAVGLAWNGSRGDGRRYPEKLPRPGHGQIHRQGSKARLGHRRRFSREGKVSETTLSTWFSFVHFDVFYSLKILGHLRRDGCEVKHHVSGMVSGVFHEQTTKRFTLTTV